MRCVIGIAWRKKILTIILASIKIDIILTNDVQFLTCKICYDAYQEHSYNSLMRLPYSESALKKKKEYHT